MSFVTTGSQPWIYKDPDAILDYSLDWSEWLDGDEISTATWIVPAGLTKVSETATATVATIWLSGGLAGSSYAIVCRITTIAGRTTDRTFRVVMKEM